jgi:hypothetical protein
MYWKYLPPVVVDRWQELTKKRLISSPGSLKILAQRLFKSIEQAAFWFFPEPVMVRWDICTTFSTQTTQPVEPVNLSKAPRIFPMIMSQIGKK